MSQNIVYSIVETPIYPDFSGLFRRLGWQQLSFSSMRKAIAALRQTPPQAVIAEFLYGYGNNYAGVNISNLDVFLYSLQKYAPQARVVVLVDKRERQYVDQLSEILPLHAVLVHPVDEAGVEAALRSPVAVDSQP